MKSYKSKSSFQGTHGIHADPPLKGASPCQDPHEPARPRSAGTFGHPCQTLYMAESSSCRHGLNEHGMNDHGFHGA
ncbi:MAG: hypothetical protein ACTSUE_20555 [Promethearchaeota archaeon]